MKLFETIDAFFNTPAKRRAWCGIVFLFGWLIFMFCLIPFSWQMMNLKTYDQLFALQASLKYYDFLWVMRMITYIMSAPSLSIGSVLLQGLRLLNFSSVIWMACALIFIAGSAQKGRIALIALGFLLAYAGIGILLGIAFQARTLFLLMSVLSVIGTVMVSVNIVFSILLALWIQRLVFQIL